MRRKKTSRVYNIEPWTAGTESVVGAEVAGLSPMERLGGTLPKGNPIAEVAGMERLCGIGGFEKKGMARPHCYHDCWTMVGIVGGEGDVACQGRTLRTVPGSIYIIPPGVPFHERNTGKGTWHFACLQIVLNDGCVPHAISTTTATWLERDFSVVARIVEVVKALHYRPHGFELKAIGGTLMLLGYLDEKFGGGAAVENSETIIKAVEIIKRNLSDPPSLPALARQCNVSVSLLSHRFKQETRLSPIQYVRRERVKAAKELILGGAGVEEAAERLGFNTQFHLSKVFTSIEGKPPIFFRNLARR